MRKITANLIYPVSSAPLKDAYLIIDDNRKIVDIVSYERNTKEIAGLEYYSGILIPGFVNAHCHLKLSLLKETIYQAQKLNILIKPGNCKSNEPKKMDEKHVQKALCFMWSRGINGLGNINESMPLFYGTNSLASNQQLSILEEMKTFSMKFPEITFDLLLEMATLNGAKALGMQDKLGSFDIGKQPGVLLVSGFDFKKLQLRKDAEVTRMV